MCSYLHSKEAGCWENLNTPLPQESNSFNYSFQDSQPTFKTDKSSKYTFSEGKGSVFPSSQHLPSIYRMGHANPRESFLILSTLHLLQALEEALGPANVSKVWKHPSSLLWDPNSNLNAVNAPIKLQEMKWWGQRAAFTLLLTVQLLMSICHQAQLPLPAQSRLSLIYLCSCEVHCLLSN